MNLPRGGPLALERPELARLREVRDWWSLGTLWPGEDVRTAAVQGWAEDLRAWADLDRAFGDEPGAAVHVELADTMLFAVEHTLLAAYDARVARSRDALPSEGATRLRSLDAAYRQHLLGETGALVAAEQAWIELASSGFVDSLDPVIALALCCDGVALQSAVYDQSGDVTTLTQLSALLESVLSKWRLSGDPPPGSTVVHLDPRLPRMAGETALALRRRFDATGEDTHLARASKLVRSALALCHPDSPDYAPWLVEATHIDAWASARLGGAGAEKADHASRYAEAAAAEPPGSRVRGRALDMLGQHAWDTYRTTHDRAVLDQAVEAWRPVVSEGGVRPPGCSERLATALLARFLEAAAKVPADLDEAVEVMGGPTEGNLAVRLFDVLQPMLGAPSSTLVDLGVEALTRLPPEPELAMRLAENARLMREHDNQELRVRWRDVRIALLRAATQLDPTAWTYRTDLGGDLASRYDASGSLDDLDSAIAELRRAVTGTGVTEPGPWLNLAEVLRRRAGLIPGTSDLAEAVKHASHACELTQTAGDERALGLALGVRASTQYDLARRESDAGRPGTALAAAEADWRRIFTLDVPEQQALAAYNLGNALLGQAVAEGSAKLGTEAIDLLERAADDLDRPSADAAAAANRLAEAIATFSDPPNTRGEEVKRWGEQAVDWARSTSAEILLRVGWDVARRAEGAEDWDAAAANYVAVLEAMAGLVGMNRDAAAQDSWLTSGYGAPTRAAYALLRCDRAVDAVDALERGRAFLLRDAIGSDTSDDAEDEPRLDPRLRHPVLYFVPGTSDGFAVLLNHSADAQEPLTLPLHGLDEKSVGWQVRQFRAGIDASADNARTWARVLDRICSWLGETLEPAFAALPAGRVTLVPTGALAFLPAHAALRPDGAFLLDTHVVHYAPSASVLAAAEARPAPPGGGALAVADPAPTDEDALPYAAVEAGVVAAFAETDPSGAAMPVRTLVGSEASVEECLAGLPGTRLLHLACHGRADLARPRASGLLMAENQMLTLPMLGNADLSSARLAVLSACETGVPGAGAPDEMLSLGAVLFGAGVDGVVSSLWQVSDAATLVLVALFYAALRDDPDDPAVALATAQRQMRAANDAELLVLLRSLVDAGRVTPEAFTVVERLVAPLPPESRVLAALDSWAGFTLTGR